MKKRNYVIVVGMIALFIQSGACAEDGAGRFDRARSLAQEKASRASSWAQSKASKVKAMTVDKLYDKAKKFVKEVKALRKCHKTGTCTEAQKREVRRAGVAIAATAALAFMVAVPAIKVAIKKDEQKVIQEVVPEKCKGNLDDLAKKYVVDLGKEGSVRRLILSSAFRGNFGEIQKYHFDVDKNLLAIQDGIEIARKCNYKSVESYLESLLKMGGEAKK